jgi:AcrR family transcriptional regulator
MNNHTTTTYKIKAAAKHLFAVKGFDAVTVKEIGQKSRSNPALINYHFGGKKELYYAIIEDFTSMSRDYAKALLRTPHSPLDFLENLNLYIRHLLQKYLDDPELHLILNRECEKGITKSSLNLFENQLLEVFTLLEEFYLAAQANQILQPTVNARVTTLLLFSTLGMLCQRNSLHERYIDISLNDRDSFDTIAQTLLEYYGRNLLAVQCSFVDRMN